jgi:hypothetical protein
MASLAENEYGYPNIIVDCRIRKNLFRIPGSKKAPDPGSATMLSSSDADPGCFITGSRFFPIPNPGSRIPDPGSSKNRREEKRYPPPPPFHFSSSTMVALNSRNLFKCLIM